jgi:hypothetical protein
MPLCDRRDTRQVCGPEKKGLPTVGGACESNLLRVKPCRVLYEERERRALPVVRSYYLM